MIERRGQVPDDEDQGPDGDRKLSPLEEIDRQLLLEQIIRRIDELLTEADELEDSDEEPDHELFSKS